VKNNLHTHTHTHTKYILIYFLKQDLRYEKNDEESNIY